MANERQEERSTQNPPTQDPQDKARRAAERATEQTRRIGLAAAETSEQVVTTGANLLQQNAEMFQNTLRFGMDMVTAMFGRRQIRWARPSASRETKRKRRPGDRPATPRASSIRPQP